MTAFKKPPSAEHGPLPAHTVKVDRRARRLRIRVTPDAGVIVVVPRARDARHVPDLLRRHAAWIERALIRVEPRRAHLASAGAQPLPDRIALPGVGREFLVEYRPSPARGIRATQRGDTVVLSGEVGDAAACRAALRRWLARSASIWLPEQLAGLAEQEGIAYTGVTIRSQRTRWGSCTRGDSVSLNRSLVFLRPELVRYVMLHELLHTIRHDHSPAFWAMLEASVPGARRLKMELREAWAQIPPWASERDRPAPGV